MRALKLLQVAALASVSVAALSLGACNPNGSSANGAYVPTASSEPAPDASAPAATPTSGGSLPPRSQYLRVAESAPPPLPVYDQPPIPGPGYVWTPGYWDWSDNDDDYYWVPGAWIEPPSPGLYWTPGYWRFYNGHYLFSAGYWAPEVGFYGGIDYGFGYVGNGYVGGRWQGGQFYYNSQVNNFGGRRIDAVYSQSAPAVANRVSFNGGPGGLRVAPTQGQIDAAHANHVGPAAAQMQQVRMAEAEPQLRASQNRGAPPIAATARAADFHTAAPGTSGGAYTPPPRTGPVRPAGPATQAPLGQEPQREAGHAPEPGRPETGRPEATPPNERSARAFEPARPVAPEHMAPTARPQAEPRPAPEARPAPPRMSEPRPPIEARPAAPRPEEARPAEHAPAGRPQEEKRGPEPR